MPKYIYNIDLVHVGGGYVGVEINGVYCEIDNSLAAVFFAKNKRVRVRASEINTYELERYIAQEVMSARPGRYHIKCMFAGEVRRQETSDQSALWPWLNKIHCADSIAAMNAMPPESVSLIVTSPPYNIKNSTGNGLKNGSGGKWPKAMLISGYDVHDDNMPHDEYVMWQRKCLTAMMRVLRPDGAIFYNHKWRVQNGLLQDRSDIVEGFPVRQIIIWKRAGGINFNAGYFLPTYEVIYLICKPDFKLAPKANQMTDVWEIPQVKGNGHPAPFPIELAQKCIEASPGGVVLDPFMGSGTTAIAAMAQGREWIGIDISQDYCEMANKRISEY